MEPDNGAAQSGAPLKPQAWGTPVVLPCRAVPHKARISNLGRTPHLHPNAGLPGV